MTDETATSIRTIHLPPTQAGSFMMYERILTGALDQMGPAPRGLHGGAPLPSKKGRAWKLVHTIREEMRRHWKHEQEVDAIGNAERKRFGPATERNATISDLARHLAQQLDLEAKSHDECEEDGCYQTKQNLEDSARKVWHIAALMREDGL